MFEIFKRNKNKRNKKLNKILNYYDFYDLPVGFKKFEDISEVKICIDKIADLVSNMTIHLMENGDNGDKRIINELSKKIDINPHRYMTKKAWLYSIVYNLVLYGNAVVVPTYNKQGLIEDLTPISSSLISYDFSNNDFYTINYGDRVFKNDEVIHFVLNPLKSNPFVGSSYSVNLKDITEALELATKTRKSFFSGKYLPNIIIKVDADTEELSSEAGRQKIESRYLERSENGKPWIIPADLLEVQQIRPLSLRDIALNEAVEIDKKTVASIFGLPCFMVGVGEYNAKEFNNFINNRIMSIAKVIEQTLTKYLLTSSSLYFKCNPRSLYSYDINEVAKIGMDMFSRGLLTGNEVRDWLGLTPIDELDKLVILENYIPIDKIQNQKKLNDNEVINK